MMNIPYTAVYAQADITPDYPVDLVGFGRADSIGRGVLSPLYAQALVLRHGGEAFCLLTIDNIGLSVQDAALFRHEIATLLACDPTHVMVFCSHSHATPNTDAAAPNGLRYLREALGKTVAAIRAALPHAVPVKAGWGHTHAEIGENRREGCTANDTRIGLLRLAHAETDAPVAVILRATAHGNTLTEENLLISSDYFGAARETLSAALGCPVMITQGAAGNIRPVKQGSPEALAEVAGRLSDAALRIGAPVAPITRLQMRSQASTFYSDIPSSTEAEQIASRAMETCGMDGAAWLTECQRLRDMGITEQPAEIEISFFQLNDGCFCGVPHEIFVESALAIARETSQVVFFGGYTNGFSGYLPTCEEWHKGGYETLYSYLLYYPYFGRMMPLRADTLDGIVGQVIEMWKGMRG